MSKNFDWREGQKIPEVLVNPGTGPVHSTTQENAERNVKAFLVDLAMRFKEAANDGYALPRMAARPPAREAGRPMPTLLRGEKMIVIDKPVPLERWGKDHWSTFAYIETRVVDHHGRLAEPQMRAGNEYPTRLKPDPCAIEIARAAQVAGKATPLPTSEELRNHDDWDCLADMVALGLVVPHGDVPDKLLNGRVLHRLCFQHKATFKLTEKGERIAGELRAHKGRGENFHSFQPSRA